MGSNNIFALKPGRAWARLGFAGGVLRLLVCASGWAMLLLYAFLHYHGSFTCSRDSYRFTS